MEDKKWVLENVEEICADTRDVDEVCMALEHSTIFATEIIQNLTKTILDLQQELSIANDKLKKIEKYIEVSKEHITTKYSNEIPKEILLTHINIILNKIKRDE